jgi:hypothetical protein
VPRLGTLGLQPQIALELRVKNRRGFLDLFPRAEVRGNYILSPLIQGWIWVSVRVSFYSDAIFLQVDSLNAVPSSDISRILK